MIWQCIPLFCPFRMDNVFFALMYHEIFEGKSGSKMNFAFFRCLLRKQFIPRKITLAPFAQHFSILRNSFIPSILLYKNYKFNENEWTKKHINKSFLKSFLKLWWPWKVRLNSSAYLSVCKGWQVTRLSITTSFE